MKTTRLVIELDHGSGPIAGWLRGGDAEVKGFNGYMELIAALEAARVALPPEAAEDPADAG